MPDRRRASQQIPLPEMATHRHERIALLLGFDALGNHVQVQRSRQRQHRSHHGCAAGLAFLAKLGDKGAINFQRPQWKRSLAETFRETDHAYLSPRRVGDALGLQIQSLAERARVSRNTPAVRPQNETLQHYLREVVRVLTAAEDVAGGDRHRAIFWFMNEPLQDFDYLTPDALVRMGKSQVVIDYIESIAGGATG